MKKAKIYKPAKTAMQSGKRNSKKWLLEFDTLNLSVNPLMGWMSSKDTLSEIKLRFTTRDEAVDYAKKNNIDYYIIEPQKIKLVKKSYSDNFIKNN
jgi:NADH dehydrogenase (ubiquinone) Fe-S protein 4